MNFVLEGMGIHLKGKWHKIGGWIAHYLIGFAMVITYEALWRYAHIKFGFISGIIFGIVSGVIGIMCWRAIYLTAIHKDVSRRSYYIQLFFGHIIFACAVVVAFKIFKYNPLSHIPGY